MSCLLCYGGVDGVGTVDVIIIVSMIKIMLILGCVVHDDLIDGAFAMHGTIMNDNEIVDSYVIMIISIMIRER